MANIAHKPTKELRKQVEWMKAGGLTNEQIAYCIEMSPKTLGKYYKEELENGKAKIDALATGNLFKKIKSGNLTAIIFYLKTRCGWQETSNVNTKVDIPVINPKLFGDG